MQTEGMMKNPAGWFEIYVDDMRRAKQFYESVFEVELGKLEGPDLDIQAFPSDMESYGASGALVKMPGYPAGANSTIVYFSCADCAVEAKRAADAGGRIEKPKTSIGQYGFIALVVDTEGNVIGLHSLQ